jgi:hypothetical protein
MSPRAGLGAVIIKVKIRGETMYVGPITRTQQLGAFL